MYTAIFPLQCGADHIWIRILYRCWKTRTPYDESRYLNALKRRGSPLLKELEAPRPAEA